MTPALWTYSQIARMIGASRWQIRRLARTYNLDTIKIGNRTHIPSSEIAEKLPLIWRTMQENPSNSA